MSQPVMMAWLDSEQVMNDQILLNQIRRWAKVVCGSNNSTSSFQM